MVKQTKIRQCEDREGDADSPATIRQEHGRGESLREQDASSDSVGLQNARDDVPSVDVPSFPKNPRVQTSRPQGRKFPWSNLYDTRAKYFPRGIPQRSELFSPLDFARTLPSYLHFFVRVV